MWEGVLRSRGPQFPRCGGDRGRYLVGRARRATIFRVEVVQQGTALEEREVAGIGEELGLLVEDIIQVVEDRKSVV